tara:strand:- start:506 stop:1189 length:684 start_codon:yes stop_codon:yes gene_type:complete
MPKLTEEQIREKVKLHNIYVNKVEAQKARGEKPIDQEQISVVLGLTTQSRVSQIMSSRPNSSPLTPEQALVFARLLDCQVKDFSPRINALLSGTPTHQISIIEGSETEIVKAARQMAAGKKITIRNGSSISYPGNCNTEVRAFIVNSTAMEPELKEGCYAYVDPTIEISSGNSVCLVKDDSVVFAKYIGNETYELTNPKFSDRVFKLGGADVEVGVVIGTFVPMVLT